MKQIILFRHGKSSWDTPGLADVDRPLLQKGRQRTLKMARHILEIGLKPDLIVSSHAVRAYQTAAIIAETAGISAGDIVIEPLLFHASTDRIWDVIISLPEEASRVLLVGHNPGFTEFASSNGIGMIDWLPTSGIATATLPCRHWHECPITAPQNVYITWPSKAG